MANKMIVVKGGSHLFSNERSEDKELFNESSMKNQNCLVKMMSHKKEWLKNDTNELISMYQNKPVLWDLSSKYYKSRIKKRHAWIELAKHFETTCEEIYRKIHNLRNQFNSEHKKMKMMKMSDDTFELTVSKWPYYEALSFLKKCITMRASKTKQCPEETYTEHKHCTIPSQQLIEDPLEQLEENSYFEIQSNDNDPEIGRKMEKMSDQNDPLIEFVQNTPHAPTISSNQEEDQYAIFGNYIASEMRHLSADYLRKKMKRKIQQVMFEISEEEEQLFTPT